VDLSEQMYGDQDSGFFPRMVGPPKDFLRGSVNNRPFRPGGLEDSQSSERVLPEGVSSGQWVQELLNGGPAQTVPPSFKQSLDLGDLMPYPQTWSVYEDHSSHGNASDENSVCRSMSLVYINYFTFNCGNKLFFTGLAL
jgi:antiviral helicase SKI2